MIDAPQLNRRAFIGTTSGLMLGFVLPAATGLDAAQAAGGTAVNSWLSIGINAGLGNFGVTTMQVKALSGTSAAVAGTGSVAATAASWP
jgi:hypothetical protein